MPRIGKGWINTAREQEVRKHPILAGLQRFRNNFLKWKIINLNSARIGPPKTDYGPTGDLVHKCLRLLSEDLGEPKNRATAYNAIKSLVTYSDNWNDSLSTVLPVRANKLQQLRNNVKFLFTEYTFDTKETAFLQAVYNKSDAVLAYPKGRYHEKFDAPAPREVPPANNAPRPANAGAGQTTADLPSPGDPPPADAPPQPVANGAVESVVGGNAPVRPDEFAPPSIANKTDGQLAAPSTDEIAQPGEKAPEKKARRAPNPAHKRINSENKPVPTLRLRDLGKTAQQTGSDVPPTPRSEVPRTPRPRGTPRKRLDSNAVKPEPKSPRSPLAPVMSRASINAKLDEILDGMNSLDGPQPPIPLENASEAMPPIVKMEGNGPPDNPATAAMPVTLSAVPPAEASATVSPPSQPQVLPETRTEPLPEATPGPRPAGDLWTREQQEMKNRELSVQLMTDLLAKINSSRPNLVAIFEILNKLTAPNLQPYRAESLGGLTLPDEERLHHVNHLMNSMRQDLLPRLSQPERGRVAAIVEEWQKLDLPRAEARPLAPWVMTEVMVALKKSDLTPPSGLAPGANG
jgi:hypothetical protein